MTLLKSNIPKHIDRIIVDKLENGYCVIADTKFAGKVGHYCSNLKGVTKALWAYFEGSEVLTKKEMEGVKGVLESQREKLERGKAVKEDA